jgi:hypothetical protein
MAEPAFGIKSWSAAINPEADQNEGLLGQIDTQLSAIRDTKLTALDVEGGVASRFVG